MNQTDSDYQSKHIPTWLYGAVIGLTAATIIAFKPRPEAPNINEIFERMAACESYYLENTNWVKSQALQDEHGHYVFKHPNGHHCTVPAIAP